MRPKRHSRLQSYLAIHTTSGVLEGLPFNVVKVMYGRWVRTPQRAMMYLFVKWGDRYAVNVSSYDNICALSYLL